MVPHRSHSVEFKRQVAQDYLAGETLHSLARRHDLSRNLIRIWIQKFEASAFDDEVPRLIRSRPERRASPRWSGSSAGRRLRSSS